ncbi:MAG: hypothetical protein KKI09_01255 [Spirochaetes bacterium]|nr:hypothetical protein [Spirochaetota bacterium]MBU0954029.1 hypothetical protein [Spirochaetota bacterium]
MNTLQADISPTTSTRLAVRRADPIFLLVILALAFSASLILEFKALPTLKILTAQLIASIELLTSESDSSPVTAVFEAKEAECPIWIQEDTAVFSKNNTTDYDHTPYSFDNPVSILWVHGFRCWRGPPLLG